MSELILSNGDASEVFPTLEQLKTVPNGVIKTYCDIHRCQPIQAFSDIFSQRLFDEIDKKHYAVVLRALVETTIGSGEKE